VSASMVVVPEPAVRQQDQRARLLHLGSLDIRGRPRPLVHRISRTFCPCDDAGSPEGSSARPHTSPRQPPTAATAAIKIGAIERQRMDQSYAATSQRFSQLSASLRGVPGQTLLAEKGLNTPRDTFSRSRSARAVSLPCRRSRVRAPSSALKDLDKWLFCSHI
jgi:hypothetical protein